MKMKFERDKIHFMELRSGHDLEAVMRKAINYHKWSGGRSCAHISDLHVSKNSFVTAYDYDIKLELIFTVLAFLLLIKKLILK